MKELDDPKPINDEMRGGLARMYADQGFREYLLHSIQIANKGVMLCMEKGDIERGKVYADRFKWLKTLEEIGKSSFVNVQKINKELKDKQEQHG